MLQFLIHKTQKHQILPFYHYVANQVLAYIKHLYTPKTVNEFIRDLNTFLRYYESVNLTQTIQTNLHNTNNKKKSFHITFDDGLSNFYHVVAPILLKKNITATVFINTDFIDNKDLFYRYKASLLVEEYLNASNKKQKIITDFILHKTNGNTILPKEFLLNITYQNKELLNVLAEEINFSFSEFLTAEKPYLSTNQIKELQNQGFTIGAHSKDHPLYQDLSVEQQIQQTLESLHYLKKEFNIKHNTFAFPFYDTNISRDFFLGIEQEITLTFGTSNLKTDEIPFNLQRLDMEKNKGNAKLFLLKNYVKLLLQKQKNKHIIKRY